MDAYRYSGNMKLAVDFIEKNIKSNVSYKEAAAAAGISQDHFWRLFKTLFRETIGSYIRSRRLTLIARQLTGSDKKITALCYEYEFDSLEVFSRSFKKQFGFSPVEYRRQGIDRLCLERQKITERTIKHILGGGITLEPKITRIRDFFVDGLSGKFRISSSPVETPKLVLKYLKKSGGNTKEKVQVLYSVVRSVEEKSFRVCSYDSYVEVFVGRKAENPEAGAGVKKIRGGKFAVFVHTGSSRNILISYDYIFSNWFKSIHGAKMPGYFFKVSTVELKKGEMTGTEIYIPLKQHK
jgi:AraC family transcriptional regulator